MSSTQTMPRRPVVPSAMLGMALFLFTEVMFFAALVSAYIVLRGQSGYWPPVDQPRLPVWGTGVNTAVLLYSGVTMRRAVAALRDSDRRRFMRGLVITGLLGTCFLVVQGAEWVALIGYGLTSSSSLYGSLFYTLVGAHGIHVLSAVVALALVAREAQRGRWSANDHSGILAMRMYWTFVVAIWPPLYALVYLW